MIANEENNRKPSARLVAGLLITVSLVLGQGQAVEADEALWVEADSARTPNSRPSNERNKPLVLPDRSAEAAAQTGTGLRAALHQAKLLPEPDGVGGENSQFGYSVSIDGNRALVGGNNLAGSGAAVVLVDHGAGWQEEAVLLPVDGEIGDQFGWSVSLDGNRALIGAQNDDDNGSNSGSAYVFAFDGTTWAQEAKLVAPDGAANDDFGFSVSLVGDRALIGAWGDDDDGISSGAAYVFAFDGTTWAQEGKLTAPDGGGNQFFGYSVSLDGDRALVGAYGDDDNGPTSGAAYVFAFDGTSWVQEDKLIASDGADLDFFGFSVSLDGDRALIGAHGDDDNGFDSGSAYVFAFDGTSWGQEGKLVAPNGAAGDSMGYSVGLAGDRALVGAWGDDDVGEGSGSAHVFAYDGTVWAHEKKLVASDAADRDRFGWAVGLDGTRALIGAYTDSDSDFGAGSAYVFAFDGTVWAQEDELAAPDGAARDFFGISVSIDGDRALVGAQNDDDNGLNAGAAYLFAFDGTTWVQEDKLVAPDGAAGDSFGVSVSIDGNRALVGADNDDDNGANSGSAYVFAFDGTTWVQEGKLLALDGASFDEFGRSVSVDGDRALVGNGAGSAYVFAFDGTIWAQEDKLIASDAAAGDFFGYSVSLGGNRALIGAQNDDDNGSNSGSAYVFAFDGTTWAQEAKLVAPDGAASDFFGRSVSLGVDRALIGAWGDDDKGSSSGSAYVFAFDGTSWTQEGKLIAPDGAASDQFGLSVSLDGSRALIGAYQDDEGGSNSGSAYVFIFNGFAWASSDKLVAPNGAAGDLFGYSVGLDGGQMLVGAHSDDDNGVDSGSVHLFVDNQPPVARPDSLSTNEDTVLIGNVLSDNGSGIDDDLDGDPLTVTAVNGVPGNVGSRITLASGALLTVDAGGRLAYDPSGEFEALAAGDSFVETFSYTISDGVAFDTATVTVTVNGVNDPPIAIDDDFATDEDTGLAGNVFADNGNGADRDPDHPLAVVNSSTLIPTGLGGSVDLQANGDFSFIPPADASGTATFDYTLEDGHGATSTATVTITVVPVNDPPMFVGGGDVTAFEDTSFDKPWASAISPGPPDEASQSVLFLVNPTTNPGLFKTGPSIDATGRLTFTPTPDATGTAEVEVVAMDDGSTPNGGDDTSAPTSFTVEVARAADLAIAKISGSFFTPPGGTLSYELLVSNAGPSDVVDARIEDPEPSRLTFGNWQCAPAGLASCNTAAGSGPVDVLVTIPKGDSVTVTVDAQITDTDPIPVTNSASVTAPADTIELAPSDNSDSDTDAVGMFVDSFENLEPD